MIVRAVAGSQQVLIPWSWVILIVGSYGLVGLGGLFLLRGMEIGEVLSLLAQALQLFGVIAGPVAYQLVAGLEVSIVFLGNHFSYFLGLSAAVSLWRGPNDPNFAVGLNLVPLAILILFARLPSPSKLLAKRDESPG